MQNNNALQQTLECPNCSGLIYFSVKELIQGAAFSCGRCNAQIKMSPASINQVEKSYKKFNDLKNKLKDKQ